LADPAKFIARTNPSYDAVQELVEALAGVAGAASTSEGRAIIDLFLQQPDIVDDVQSRPWARLLHAVPDNAWDPRLIESVVLATSRQHERLHLIALGLAVDHGGVDAKEQLVARIRQGSFDALSALGGLDRLPTDVAAVTIERVESRVARIVADAKQGLHSLDPGNYGRVLTVLNINHPDLARWDSIYALLEEPSVPPADKNAACSRLVRRADSLPDVVRARLAAIAGSMVDHPVLGLDRVARTSDRVGPAAALSVRIGANESKAATLLIRALASDPSDRAWVPLLTLGLPVSVAVGVLAVLAHDSQSEIREAAASCAIKLIDDGHHDEYLYEIVRNCASDPGTRVRSTVADGLSRVGQPSEMAVALLEVLATDISARVRFTPGSGHRVSRTSGSAERMSSCLLVSAGRTRLSTRSRLRIV
jgi:hypothetical protein